MGRARLDRYVMREIAGPAALGFLVYTFLLLMQGVFALMEQIFVRGVPFREGLGLLALTLPHVVVLTIPMSFLFGVLLAVGRMNGDNEIVALLAAGVPPRRLLVPILLFAVFLSVLNGYLYVEVMPSANRRLREMKVQLFANAKGLGRIEPGVFHEDFPNLLVFVKDVDQDTGTWKDVVLFDSSDPAEERLTLARRGRVVARTEAGVPVKSGGSEPWLLLEDVVNHQFAQNQPETHRVNTNQEQLYRLPVPDEGAMRYVPGMRERATAELWRYVRSGGRDGLSGMKTGSPEEKVAKLRLAGLELHQRVAIPAASFVFGLLALPLGIGARSGGRGRGFVLSIVVVLAYYVMNNHGALLATEGRIPVWLGVWLPNMVLTALALGMMLGMGRWLGERRSGEGWLASLVDAWRRWRTGRSERRGRRQDDTLTGSIPIAIQRRRYGSRFPTLLDRYLLRRLVGPLSMVLLSCCSLYMVVDLTDHVDEMAKNHVPLGVILGYYWNLLPQIVVDVTPFALMIAVLVLFTLLERKNELTALKGAGISLYRLILPVILVSLVCVVMLWILGDSILPSANRDATMLLDRIKGRESARTYQAANRQWLLSRDGSTLYNFLRYDTASRTLIRFTMYRLDDDMNLRFHLFAHRVAYRNGGWIADSGWFRQFYPDGHDEFHRIESPMELRVPEAPTYFGQDYRRPDEMRVAELAAYIRELKASGYEPTQQIVRLHEKFSYPLSALVMVLLALPFGLNRGGRRVTTMQGVALSLAVGIGYFIAMAVFGKMGEADILPPVVGAWAPVILASLLALNRMTTLRT